MVHLYRIEAIILNANQKEKKKDCVLYTHTEFSATMLFRDIRKLQYGGSVWLWCPTSTGIIRTQQKANRVIRYYI